MRVEDEEGDPHSAMKSEGKVEAGEPRGASIRVPGARASTYVGRSVLNSFLRHLMRSRSRVGAFARSFCCQTFDRAMTHDTAFRGLFPVPIPYPEALCRGARDDARRLCEKKAICAVVIVLNYLHLGRPRECSKELLMRRPLSKIQWDGVRRLEFLMKAWLDVSPVDANSMGRIAGKVESLEDSLKALEKAAQSLDQHGRDYFSARVPAEDFAPRVARGWSVGILPHCDEFSTFKQVDPSRLSFTGVPGFDPSYFLDEGGRRIYEEPIKHRRDPNSYTGKLPKLKVHCSFEEKVKLFELLDSSGRLGVHRPSEIDGRFTSGLFSVVKDLSKDRLILDARASNCLETPGQRWIQSLACGESLCRILLEQGESIRSSGNDLRDYYYLFRIGEERSQKNSLVGTLPVQRISHLKAIQEKQLRGGLVHGALRSLAMGDTWAVELAQTAHLSIALNSGVLRPESLLSMHQPVPRSRNFAGLVIDDFISLSIVDETETGGSPCESARMADEMFKEYKRVRLIPNEKKAFRDEEDASFWGVDLAGGDGLVRGSLKRAVPLVGLLLRVVKIGYATGKLLEILAGSIISLMLFRRRLLSMLDSLFASYRGRDRREIIALDGRTRTDLLCICVLLPLCVTNLRSKVSSRITATDASNWGEAAVVGALPYKIAKEVYRHCLRKSLWVKLLAPAKAWLRAHGLLEADEEVPEEGERYHSHPLWQLLGECLKFEELYAMKKSGNRHINIGELRGMLKAEERHAQRGGGCREIYALDSQVALGCLVKGRSSSSSLNNELVRSVPTMLMREMYGDGIYFETSINRADDPTRGKAIREPSRPLPAWWEALSKGDFRGFDDWMVLHGVHPDMIGKLPAFSELLHGERLEEMLQEEERKLVRCKSFSVEEEKVDTEEGEIAAEEEKEEIAALRREGSSTEFASSRRANEERTEAETTEAESTEAEEDRMRSSSLSPVWKEAWKTESGEKPRFDEEDAAAERSSRGDKQAGENHRGNGPRRAELSKKCQKLLQSVPISQFVGLDGGRFDSEVKGFLDLFSGVRGVARELARLTGRWVLCYDIEHSPNEDLDSDEVKAFIEKLVASGCFLGVGGGPVCGSFSTAVTPPVRSREYPMGRPGVSESMQRKIDQGNRFAAWMVLILGLALSMKMGVWLENPASSWLFRLPLWKQFMEEHTELGVWLVDYCRFYMRWRKRTAIVSNSELRGHRTLCRGGHEHLVLRGRCKEKKKNWTRIAQSYPRGVALALAYGLASFKGLATWHGKFDLSSLC